MFRSSSSSSSSSHFQCRWESPQLGFVSLLQGTKRTHRGFGATGVDFRVCFFNRIWLKGAAAGVTSDPWGRNSQRLRLTGRYGGGHFELNIFRVKVWTFWENFILEISSSWRHLDTSLSLRVVGESSNNSSSLPAWIFDILKRFILGAFHTNYAGNWIPFHFWEILMLNCLLGCGNNALYLYVQLPKRLLFWNDWLAVYQLKTVFSL